MHEDLCTQFMYHLDRDGSLNVGKPPVHIQYWLDDVPESPHKFFAPAAPNFDVFLYRVAEGKFVPGDYYAAWQFNDFLAREGIAEHRSAGDGNKPSNEA